MTASPVKIWLSLLLLATLAYGLFTGWRIHHRLNSPSSHSAPVASEPVNLVGHQVAPFQLIERSGRPFDSEELQGQVWVASFFFSSCPGACLRMNDALSRLQTELSDQPVRFVSISVDPETDTPAVLQQYAEHYHADPQRWAFLTGPASQVRALAMDEFKVAFGKEAHSDRLILVDQTGRIRGYYRGTVDAELDLLRQKINQLVRKVQ